MVERWEKKCEGIASMQRNMNKLLKQVSDDLLSKDEKTALTALVVRIILRTSERVGNDESAKNGHFGVTGFNRSHISELHKDGNLTLRYVGKSGVTHKKWINIGTLGMQLLLPLSKRQAAVARLFQTIDGTHISRIVVNDYLAQFGVTAKDIRCYNCNDIVLKNLRFKTMPKTLNERKTVFNTVLKDVAAYIGHGAPTLRRHYLIPSIETQFINFGKINSSPKC